MVIASWNVNSIKARMEHVLGWLEARQPDVLLLQELKGAEFPGDVFESVGYRWAAVPQKAYNGVAVLARGEIEVVSTTLAGDEEDSHARYLEVMTGGVRVVNIYAPNGNPVGTPKFEYKLAWMERLRRQMAGWVGDGVPTVVAGDFNVIPEEIDCFRASDWTRDALFQPETRAAWRALLGLGYVDALRTCRPGEAGVYTFWDYFRQNFEKDRGIRIDHFLVSAEVARGLVKVEVDKGPRGLERPSDHTVVVMQWEAGKGSEGQ